VNFQFTLPDLGEGMAEVEVISWHVAEGDEVVSDQALLSVETDKLITDLPSPVAGRILELSVAEGEKVPVGQTLLIIDTVDTLGAESPRRDPPQATASSSHPASAVESPAQADTHRSAPTAARPRVKAAPAVRKLAIDLGLDLSRLSGTGPGGRVTIDDVRGAAEATPAARPAAPTAQPPHATATNGRPSDVRGPGPRLGDRVPMTAMRRQIAHNLTESWTRIPQCVDFREVDAGALVETRRVIATERSDLPAPSFDAFMVKFAAFALARYPIFNSKLDESSEEIMVEKEINIGVATKTPDGILVPVLRHIDEKTLDEISFEIDGAAARARARQLTSEQLRGGTFTVNNIGALDPRGGGYPTPLINWPEVAILGFGRITDRVVAIDGQPAVRPTMLLTVTADHRLIDGADVAAFTNTLVALIREPRLLIGGLR
jgi:pyruvate dehydrogenase E2 component (dihydrolipoamide acetyltransferase)